MYTILLRKTINILHTLENDDTAESRRSWDWLLGGCSTVLPNPE